MKKIDVYSVPDVKNDKGLWLKSYRPEPFVQHHTRSGIIWNGINYRTKKTKECLEKWPTNLLTTNDFKDFQEFAEWCQGEYGYWKKDVSGSFWAIDKDLLSAMESRCYSPSTCMFVPQSVNSLFTSRVNHRGKYPLGVIFHKRDHIYESSCNNGKGRVIYLGRYDNPEDAHVAWQKYKIDVVKTVLRETEYKDHRKMIYGLNRMISKIEDDITAGRETKI